MKVIATKFFKKRFGEGFDLAKIVSNTISIDSNYLIIIYRSCNIKITKEENARRLKDNPFFSRLVLLSVQFLSIGIIPHLLCNMLVYINREITA